MSDIIELFGHPTADASQKWEEVAQKQGCPFLDKKCIKVRKSQPEVAIGTCSVLHGRAKRPIVICPHRLLERNQIFTDCFHLLSLHEPGNELHVVSEISVPGGSVDYFIVSARKGKIRDFVGPELQSLDTTGTVWPARQKFLRCVGVSVEEDTTAQKIYGMNWKMTAKTTLLQLHHKVQTFEALNKHLVLVIQDSFLQYLRNQFRFSHVSNVRQGDPGHIHSYQMSQQSPGHYRLELDSRLSTDSAGIATCLGLQGEAKIELREIVEQVEARISEDTLLELR